MTYIKSEDIEKLRNKVLLRWGPNDTDATRLAELSLFAEINSLPSIDPQAMIGEMIEENRDEVYMEGKETTRTEIEYELLKELLNKLPK